MSEIPVTQLHESAPELTLEIPAHARHLGVAAGFIRAAARVAGFEEDGVEAVEIAVMEAVDNVIDHARVGHEESVTIVVRQSGDDLIVEIRDMGVPWPERVLNGEVGVEMPPIYSERGRGMAMMRALMDEVTPLQRPDGGKTLRMVKRLLRVAADA